MSAEFSDQQQAIREQIGAAQEEVAALEAKLAAVDGELAALASTQHRDQLVERVCAALEELEQEGAAELFWGEATNGEAQVRAARERTQAFAARVAEVEDRRRQIVEALGSRNEHLELLDYELTDLLEEEESLKAEWIIEREESPLPARVQVMPWTRGVEEDWRFRRALAASLAATLLIAMLLPLVDLPILEREELAEPPERVARLIQREREVPPPQPVIEPLPEPEPLEPRPEPEPVVAEERPEPVTPAVSEPAPQESRGSVDRSPGALDGDDDGPGLERRHQPRLHQPQHRRRGQRRAARGYRSNARGQQHRRGRRRSRSPARRQLLRRTH